MSQYPETISEITSVRNRQRLLIGMALTGVGMVATAALVGRRCPNVSQGLEITGGILAGAATTKVVADICAPMLSVVPAVTPPSPQSVDWVLYDRVFHHFGG